MNTLSYKGNTAKIEFDPDDNILFGNIIGIRDTVGFHGESLVELKDAFHDAVDRNFYDAIKPKQICRFIRKIVRVSTSSNYSFY